MFFRGIISPHFSLSSHSQPAPYPPSALLSPLIGFIKARPSDAGRRSGHGSMYRHLVNYSAACQQKELECNTPQEMPPSRNFKITTWGKSDTFVIPLLPSNRCCLSSVVKEECLPFGKSGPVTEKYNLFPD